MSKTNQRKHQYYASPDRTPDDPAPAEMPVLEYSDSQWDEDCLEWRGQPLIGLYAHWCPNYDNIPMDETCPEWPCQCGIEEIVAQESHEQ